jgi:hypothetical protein
MLTDSVMTHPVTSQYKPQWNVSARLRQYAISHILSLRSEEEWGHDIVGVGQLEESLDNLHWIHGYAFGNVGSIYWEF